MSKLHPLFEQVLSDLGMPQDLRCDDCEAVIFEALDKYCRLSDLWGRLTGVVMCENCREKRWDRQEERKMEET